VSYDDIGIVFIEFFGRVLVSPDTQTFVER
jgi:hypothetical protein